MKQIIPILLFLFVTAPAWATTYYVDNSIADCAGSYAPATRACSGGSATSYNTIGEAEDVARAGDIVYVRSGTYRETVTCGYSGSIGSGYITFAAYPGEEALDSNGALRNGSHVIVTGFNITGQSYINVIEFEFNGKSAAQIRLTNSNHIQILFNYFSYSVEDLGAVTGQSGNSYITVRGNRAYYVGCRDPLGICAGNAQFVHLLSSDLSTPQNYNLVEYNHVQRASDFIYVYGLYNVARNNYLHDFPTTESVYWPSRGGGAHSDMFQWAGNVAVTPQHNVIEANYCTESLEPEHSHLVQLRDSYGTSHEIIVRGNVGYNFGAYPLMARGVDRLYWYNNTIVEFNSPYPFDFSTEGSSVAEDNFLYNSVFRYAKDTNSGNLVPAAGTRLTKATNICYQSGSDSSCTYSDPLFNNNTSDFTLQSGSPARAAGTPLTTVSSANGSGTTFAVTDARWFSDGYGITTGDKLIVGTDPVQVTSIRGNNITVSESFTWANGDAVVHASMGSSSTPDAGAYPYKAGGYTLTATYVVSGGTVTVTPSDASLVRFVEVFENNVPVGADYSSPFTVSGVGNGTVTVKVYKLYASTAPVVTATSGHMSPPAAPAGVHIIGQ